MASCLISSKKVELRVEGANEARDEPYRGVPAHGVGTAVFIPVVWWLLRSVVPIFSSMAMA
jgi:hypothetical protein